MVDAIEPAARGLSLTGRPLPDFSEPVSAPLGHTPLRRAGSVRRTMAIDVHWPKGARGAGHYLGRCRDIVTGDPAATPEVRGEAMFEVTAFERQIGSIEATPAPPRLQELVGARGGGHLRNALADAVADDKAAGTPLYLILDDLAGTTLISRWAFAHSRTGSDAAVMARTQMPVLEGVCIGFRPGSSALGPDGRPAGNFNASRVVPLPHPDDPDGWHPLPQFAGAHFRRARCIDVWREGDEIIADSRFQDSTSAPDGGDRWAIHEYRLRARIGADGRLLELEATPGTLPYAACQVAYLNNEVLIGTPARALRETVLERLKRTAGCTHLNDTLRALAEVPVLAGHLPPD